MEGATVCVRCARLERNSLIYDVDNVGSVCAHCLDTTDNYAAKFVPIEDRFDNLQMVVNKTLEILHSSLNLVVIEEDGRLDSANVLKGIDRDRKWKIRDAIKTLEGA